MKQLFIGIASIAGLMAALMRGYQLFGSRGMWLFSVFAVAALILAFFLIRRWNKARFVGISIVCLPLIPITFPKMVMTDFDHMSYVGNKERSAATLNRILAADSRFYNVSASYEAPANRKGQWLVVTGIVASTRDLESLREIVDRADDWRVEWSVLVSEESKVKS
ncbi:hypothetical protein [Pirellula sp. SH-Sr6A]|uniref:hypothetical protein n=1 Tax=Pirellula sp. SH-Sr6A TaxID=1632865 RepID=UPI0011BA9F1B|nr:hypothetical protein [Pirellula sp. SH-Sr6A]